MKKLTKNLEISMLDSFVEKSPAKINLFLKVLNKRNDNFHNIKSEVTLINLYDEIYAKKSSFFSIKYIGNFAPRNNKFDDCILEKIFKTFKINKPSYDFIIKKNIPVQSGLGSASSNAAAMFRLLEKLKFYKIKKITDSDLIGSDVPLFLKSKDCLIEGKGNKITTKKFPKYYFLLVKPISNCSTKLMYKLFDNNKNKILKNNFDKANDFEDLIRKKYKEIDEILNYFGNFEKVISFTITGSGSCCFALFNKKEHAQMAQKKFKRKFPSLWSFVAENNT